MAGEMTTIPPGGDAVLHPVTLPAPGDRAKAILLARLAGGCTITSASRSAGISRQTAWRWLRSDPHLVAELNRCRDEMLRAVEQSLRLLSASAVRAIRRTLVDPDVQPAARLRAAEMVLRFVLSDAKASAPTEPEDVAIRFLARDRRRRLESLMAGPSWEGGPGNAPPAGGGATADAMGGGDDESIC